MGDRRVINPPASQAMASQLLDPRPRSFPVQASQGIRGKIFPESMKSFGWRDSHRRRQPGQNGESFQQRVYREDEALSTAASGV